MENLSFFGKKALINQEKKGEKLGGQPPFARWTSLWKICGIVEKRQREKCKNIQKESIKIQKKRYPQKIYTMWTTL